MTHILGHFINGQAVADQRFYTRRKTITQRWPTSEVREGATFSMPTLG